MPDMSQLSSDLEQAILRDIWDGAPVSLERALLVLSGLETEEEINFYHRKLDDIFDRFISKCGDARASGPSNPPLYLYRSIAKCLFEYLWNSKPRRFGEYFLLADVVDAQLDSDLHRRVGTCVGLTSLYSVLGLRAGLKLSLLTGLDHLLNRLWVGPQAIGIDNTDPQGFDCCNGEGFRDLPLVSLIANVLNSRGMKNESEGRLAAAKADYGKAILTNPEYANARNNRGNMRFLEGDMEGAMADYSEAIRLEPSFREAYCNRGIAEQILGRNDEARRDYNRAMNTGSGYTDARERLRLLDALERGQSCHRRKPGS
jgi:tetratricopeptide (TPR) repeat protein